MDTKKEGENSNIKVDIGGDLKNIFGGLGNIGKLVEAAKSFGNLTEEQKQRLEDANTLIKSSGNVEGLTEEQQERFDGARERLAERGETVFGNDKLMGSHSFNINIGGKSIGNKPDRERSSGESSFDERAPTKMFKKPSKIPEKIYVSKPAEPNIDIFHEDNGMCITIELPGVKKENITVRVEGNILDINVIGEKKYHKEIDISPVSNPETITYTYNNGILSIEIYL